MVYLEKRLSPGLCSFKVLAQYNGIARPLADHEYELEKIESRLKSLELRLARLESASLIPEVEIFKSSEDTGSDDLKLSLDSEKADEEEKGPRITNRTIWPGMAGEYSFAFWHYFAYSVFDDSGLPFCLSYSRLPCSLVNLLLFKLFKENK